MKAGDIIQNPWVSNDSPLRNTMYIGTNGKYFSSLYFYQGKIQKAQWYAHDKEQFKVVGHLQGYDAFKESLRYMSSDSINVKTVETIGYADKDGLMPAT